MNDHQTALVAAYVMGARAKTHDEMVSAVKLSKMLENGLTDTQIAQARLEAELELEPMKDYRG